MDGVTKTDMRYEAYTKRYYVDESIACMKVIAKIQNQIKNLKSIEHKLFPASKPSCSWPCNRI